MEEIKALLDGLTKAELEELVSDIRLMIQLGDYQIE